MKTKITNKPKKPLFKLKLHLIFSKFSWAGLSLKISLIVFAYIIFWVSLNLISDARFFVKGFEIKGLKKLPSLVVESKISKTIGSLAPFINKDKLRNKIEELAWVKTAEISYHYPNKIQVNITEWESSGIVALASLYHFDKNGVIFKRLEQRESIQGRLLVSGVSRKQFNKNQKKTREFLKQGLELIQNFELAFGKKVSDLEVSKTKGFLIITEQNNRFRFPMESGENLMDLAHKTSIWMAKNQVEAKLVDVSSSRPGYVVLMKTSGKQSTDKEN